MGNNSIMESVPQKKKNNPWVLAIVIVLIIVIAAAVIVPKLHNTSTSYQQPSFAFITTQQLKSIYHENFTAVNYTQNITQVGINLSGSTSNELQKMGMWVYIENQTSGSMNINGILVLIMEVKNSSDAAQIQNDIINSLKISTTMVEIGNGTYMNFVYKEYRFNTNTNINATFYFAYNGKFILLQEFIGGVASNSLMAFHAQIKDMY